MYCMGGKMTFTDGRAAVVRSAEEAEKILAMNVQFSNIRLTADSLALEIELEDNQPKSFEWKNMDKNEIYNLAGSASFEDMKKIIVYFCNTGERLADYEWAAK